MSDAWITLEQVFEEMGWAAKLETRDGVLECYGLIKTLQ